MTTKSTVIKSFLNIMEKGTPTPRTIELLNSLYIEAKTLDLSSDKPTEDKLKLLEDIILLAETNCKKCDAEAFHPCESCGPYQYIKRYRDIKG